MSRGSTYRPVQFLGATSNIFPDSMMAVAAVVRLVYHADIIEMTGESYRKRAQVAKHKES